MHMEIQSSCLERLNSFTSCMYSSTKRKKSSSTSSGIHRRASSLLSSARDRLQDEDDEEDDDEQERREGGENGVMGDPTSPFPSSSSAPPYPDLRKMSLTERRLAKERDQFSARNLFNVRRKNSSSTSTFTLTTNNAAGSTDLRRRDVSPESSRTTTPTHANDNRLHPSSFSSHHRRGDRPRTSPAAYDRGRNSSRNKNRGYLRPTTAVSSSFSSSFSSSRLNNRRDEEGEEDYDRRRTPRRPRSRRELQRLVELKVDPFEDKKEEALRRAGQWASSGDRRQDLLHELQVGQPRLQARVTAFLRTLEEFTRRDRKTGLEQILEAT